MAFGLVSTAKVAGAPGMGGEKYSVEGAEFTFIGTINTGC
jgi:hypothetical protein